MENTLQVNMFGGFSLHLGDHGIDDSNNRMRKVWLLLAYLIYSRHSRTTQSGYLALIDNPGSESEDPYGKLKALFFRARAMLDKLEDGLGHKLIIRKDGSYAWNSEFPLRLDVEDFDRLLTEARSKEGDERLALLLEALQLFNGDFLPKLSMESWAMPINAYYHQHFLDAAQEALVSLKEQGRWAEAADLSVKALKIEPYSEELYQHLMHCQIAAGDRIAAVTTYENMSELLFDTFGVMPSEESRKLYREASRESTDSASVPSETIRGQLKEPASNKGAMYCEYDFFKLLYQVQARSIIRSGDVIHIALLSLHDEDGRSLPRRKLDTAMENLQSLVIESLRQGDVVTRCSASQLIIMLPQANYENSCLVCQRIIRNFNRQYPHTPARVRFSVHPLEPSVPGAQPV